MASRTFTPNAAPGCASAASRAITSHNSTSPAGPSVKNPHGGDRSGGRTKAPANGFLLFRSDYKAVPVNQVTTDGRRKKETEITKDAAATWKELPRVVRDDYLDCARSNLAEHKREHREYWSQRRGRDGRFVRVPGSGWSGSGSVASARVGGQPKSAPSSPPYLFPRPFPSPGGSPSGPIGSLGIDPGFILDPLGPLAPSHSLTTTSSNEVQTFSFDVPFGTVLSAVDPPRQNLPFHHSPATSSDASQSFPVHIPSSAHLEMSSPTDTLPCQCNHLQPLHPAIHYHYFDAAHLNLDQCGELEALSHQNTAPLQHSTQEFSSRTLTLSNSDWEVVDLFLSIGATSGASTSTPATVPHSAPGPLYCDTDTDALRQHTHFYSLISSPLPWATVLAKSSV